jgi:uracil phosphoribosyltransferase
VHTDTHPNLIISPSKAHGVLFTKLRGKSFCRLPHHHKLSPQRFFISSYCQLQTVQDTTTTSRDFVVYAKRSMRILIEDALAEFPTTEKLIDTPCEQNFHGWCSPQSEMICAVSIVRSGDALVEVVREVEPGIRVGKILIQRNESTPEKTAELFYTKLPKDIANMHVLLCDPMLATGGSALEAIKTLVEHGVNPSSIIFANMICAPEGLKVMAETYPMIKIVTVCVDRYLNSDKYIVPGLGDYGDRFFNT